MGQILAIYMGMAIVICHFFRKFCQDPELSEDETPKNEKGKTIDEGDDN